MEILFSKLFKMKVLKHNIFYLLFVWIKLHAVHVAIWDFHKYTFIRAV